MVSSGDSFLPISKTFSKIEETTVIIVGAGPAGLATSACLNTYSIPNIVLEREDCSASLWRKRAYERLKLHLAKDFCELPHMPFPRNSPKFVPRKGFVNYLDNYVSKFEISPRYMKNVEGAIHDGERWVVKYLVVATGENSEGVVPNLPGLDEFNGEVIHSNQYRNGERFKGKDVLVVGCGNSGMEIAFDLSNSGAKPSLVVRSPVHILTKKITDLGMRLSRHLPVNIVDSIIIACSKVKFGDLSKYGIERPKLGPFSYKWKTGRTPTIDTGTVRQIKAGKIKVVPVITGITKNDVTFANQKTEHFDVIIFATGYKSTVRNWLKDDHNLFNEIGLPMRKFPNNHWKGKNNIYCVGFAERGLNGISIDAINVATHIKKKILHEPIKF
ncbi:Probable indole-3-pyruvate monooxygenase YUCCA11 [Linum perenne]